MIAFIYATTMRHYVVSPKYMTKSFTNYVLRRIALLVFLLRAEARGGAYPMLDFHWFVLLND